MNFLKTSFESTNYQMKFNYFNLTLYNKIELLTKLPRSNHENTNEELMQQAYMQWGENLFREINADFAFSFYDKPKDILYAARDTLGVKALYYAIKDGKYYFSDNIDTCLNYQKLKKK